MQTFAYVVLAFTFDEVIAIIGLIASVLQALVLPVTIFLLVVQTRAMRIQTTALVEQSKEMTAQTRVFIDTIYSATFQGLYDAEAHIGELMMTYPEASRILMGSKAQAIGETGQGANNDVTDTSLKAIDPALRERVRWLGTAMLDFFEHIWTQSQKGGLPSDVWEAWEEYMGRVLCETRLRQIWQAERGYYSAGFQRFLDLKIGLAPDILAMPLLPRPMPAGGNGPLAAATAEGPAPQVARVLRAVVEDAEEENK
jgi:hypothetical protein